MARQLFIYWKLPRADAAQAEAAARRLQQTLREKHAGLQARLYRRADEAGDSTTLMETYALPGRGIGAELQAAIQATMAPCSPGARHLEVFDELPP